MHLFGQGRKELMLIYAEDLAPTGLTASDLLAGGKHEDRWPEIQKALIANAQQQILLQETGTQ